MYKHRSTIPETNIEAAGCVLAGGRSRRMGTDKALLELDGRKLISLAIEQFEGFHEVFISSSDTERYAFLGLPIVPDELPGMGPIGGLISALKASGSPYVCFRPVDTPLVPKGIHSMLAGACLGKDAAAPVFQGSPEPLLSCFSKTALPVLESLAACGDFKISNVFPLLNTILVPLDAPECLDLLGDPSAYLANANDPEAFSSLKSLIR